MSYNCIAGPNYSAESAANLTRQIAGRVAKMPAYVGIAAVVLGGALGGSGVIPRKDIETAMHKLTPSAYADGILPWNNHYHAPIDNEGARAQIKQLLGDKNFARVAKATYNNIAEEIDTAEVALISSLEQLADMGVYTVEGAKAELYFNRWDASANKPFSIEDRQIQDLVKEGIVLVKGKTGMLMVYKPCGNLIESRYLKSPEKFEEKDRLSLLTPADQPIYDSLIAEGMKPDDARNLINGFRFKLIEIPAQGIGKYQGPVNVLAEKIPLVNVPGTNSSIVDLKSVLLQGQYRVADNGSLVAAFRRFQEGASMLGLEEYITPDGWQATYSYFNPGTQVPSALMEWALDKTGDSLLSYFGQPLTGGYSVVERQTAEGRALKVNIQNARISCCGGGGGGEEGGHGRSGGRTPTDPVRGGGRGHTAQLNPTWGAGGSARMRC